MVVSFPSFQNILHKLSANLEKQELLQIPLSTFLSIWVNTNNIHIAELGGQEIKLHKDINRERNVRNMLISWLEENSHEKHLKFVGAEIIAEKWLHPLISDLWLHEDIVPYFKEIQEGEQIDVQKDYVKNISLRFGKDQRVHVAIARNNEVLVGELVVLEDFKGITPPQEFSLLLSLAKKFQGKKITFISATPQGGGVAIMRHALIRLLRLLGVNAHWFVLYPSAEAFYITKTKFHNVLQGVASPDTVLTEEDKKTYNAWISQNAELLKDSYVDADVVVIDDPQPSGLVEYMRKANPKAKILYRSHIQIESELANTKGTPQQIAWDFIWNNIKDTDLFISHPVEAFIPKNVPSKKIVMMPATTDALDGLNKRLAPRFANYYLKIFDKLLISSGQEPLDMTRPYIIQVARFDPSKGIPDVIESYRLLVEKLEKTSEKIPQLVIIGHGSIDDPDGVPLFNLTMEMIKSPKYQHLAKDIKVARLSHIDQIFNVLLKESKVALQLSHKEGFEVKVSEALMKGIPVIAYHAGGIPLQIEDGKSGYLLPVGDVQGVAEKLYQLFINDELYYEMRKGAKENVNPQTSTVSNAINWLFLANQIIEKGDIVGNRKNVKELIQESLSAV